MVIGGDMMDIRKLSTKEVGDYAKRLVAEKLEDFGISVGILKGPKNIVIAKSTEGYPQQTIRVKSRRSGNWQIPITEGASPETEVDDREFWVLVDFIGYPEDTGFYVMPGSWLRRRIHEDHENWLASHGGTRPVTPKSTHHRVVTEVVEQWKDRWDIIGL